MAYALSSRILRKPHLASTSVLAYAGILELSIVAVQCPRCIRWPFFINPENSKDIEFATDDSAAALGKEALQQKSKCRKEKNAQIAQLQRENAALKYGIAR